MQSFRAYTSASRPARSGGHTAHISGLDGEFPGRLCEAARVFHGQTNLLVRRAYDLHELLDIHQRERVVWMLQIRHGII